MGGSPDRTVGRPTMSLKLIIRPEARVDLAEAKIWYDKQRKGLAGEFKLCIEEAMERIRRMAELGGKEGGSAAGAASYRGSAPGGAGSCRRVSGSDPSIMCQRQPRDPDQRGQQRQGYPDFEKLAEAQLNAVAAGALDDDQVGDGAQHRQVAGQRARHRQRQPGLLLLGHH